MSRILVLALLLLVSPWSGAEESELLEPEKAFQFSARMTDAKTIEAVLQAADGYYLYKDKIRFSSEGARIGKPALPAGKVKQDEYFGKVEVYYGSTKVRIPVTNPGKPFTLKAEFQGCADLGVCYPPQDATVRVQPYAEPAKPADTASTASSGTGLTQSPDLIARLKQLSGTFSASNGEPEFMPPEEAFKLALETGPEGVTARFTVAPGHYLYRDKTELRVQSPAGVKLGPLNLPKGKEKNDPYFGKTYIYDRSFVAKAPFVTIPPGVTQATLEATFQGCSDQGICFPPMDQIIKVSLPGPLSAPSTEPSADGLAGGVNLDSETAAADSIIPEPPGQAAAVPAPASPASADAESESSKVAALLQGGNYWLIIVSFFGFGLLLSLTPCVFPMIPILSGIIVGQGKQVTKTRGFMLSLAYVLGMAVTYALAGVAAGMSGTLISNALQNPWALGFGALIFVALAFSMFGFYELQMPSFLQSRFSEASNRVKGGKLTGVFAMGALSALIVGPCVAAPLAGALLYIGQTGDLVLGGVSLFSLALGMGVPLLLVGIAGGALLPRAGAWMEAVKKFFGVMMIAIAIWLISPMLPEFLVMILWAALLVISGIYMKAIEPLAVNASGWQRFWKGSGILLLVAGIAILLGALGGSRDMLQPLSVFKGGSAGAAATQTKLPFVRVANVAELDQAIQAAQGKYVMLDFYADWCVSCKEMERFTFSDPAVHARLADVVLLKADVTANSPEDKALLKRFSLFGPPGIIFFDRSGQELGFRVIGYEPKDKFLDSLNKVLIN